MKQPTAGTLRRYGLTVDDWRGMVRRQGPVCFVCRKLPSNRILCIDHEHVRGWKRMPPSERKLHVRGLLCSFCNFRILRKGVTLEKLARATLYLHEHRERRATCSAGATPELGSEPPPISTEGP